MLIETILAMLGGFGLHQTKRVVDHMPTGWDRLASFAIGVAGALPFVALFWTRLGDEVKPAKRGFTAYLLGFLTVGCGVALGWLVDSLRNE